MGKLGVGACWKCGKLFPKTLRTFKKWKWVKVNEDTDALVCPKCVDKISVKRGG